MDNEPLYSRDPLGNYWLAFPNKYALTIEEIKDVFSLFGKVTLITASGDHKGMRFVQFSCLEDVQNAAENLQHPRIKLVPYRPKNSKNNQTNSAIKKEITDIDPEKRNFFQRKPASNISNPRNSSENRPCGDSNTVDFQNIEFESNYDKTSTCSSNASNSRMNLDGFSTNNYYNDKSQLFTSPTHTLKSAVDPDSKVKMLLQTRGINSCTFNTSTTTNSSRVHCDYEEELPDLVASNNIKLQAISRKIIYNADEVIVANIPNNYGSAYILHLFEEFEPLAISHIMIAPRNKIRYCHVYFKSVEDSMGAETMFDKYNLCGKRLVVLRLCNLEEEVVN